MTKLDVFHTHMELYPYSVGDIPAIENMYTAIDHHTGSEVPCGYLIDNGKLYLPRGTSISKLESILNIKATYVMDSDPSQNMRKQHSALYDPRDEIQEKSIQFLIGPEHQKALNLKTGLGKTFCVAYASTKLRLRTLIITPNEGLKVQWMNTYAKMFGYRESDMLNIAGGAVIQAILNDSIDPVDVYFVNHSTLRNYLTSTNGWMFHQFMKKLKIGIKVYDESHMDFMNILMVDFFSNTEQTWYLSATFARSDKTEEKCFRQAFSSLIAYGEEESMEVVQKHVVYHVVQINSQISPYHRAKLMGYPGFSAIKYGKYAFFEDKNQTAYKAILQVLNIMKNTEGKILIFVPLIDAVDQVASQLRKDISGKSIGQYHSRMAKEDKESDLKKDIIVSTIKSCGTGKDIPGLRAIISCEPIASKVVAEQMIGRLRPYGKDMDTYFFDIVSIDIMPCNWWWKGRFKRIQQLVKKVVYLQG